MIYSQKWSDSNNTYLGIPLKNNKDGRYNMLVIQKDKYFENVINIGVWLVYLNEQDYYDLGKIDRESEINILINLFNC